MNQSVLAHENALLVGAFNRNPGSPEFLGLYEYLASDEEDGVIVADHFRSALGYITISRPIVAPML